MIQEADTNGDDVINYDGEIKLILNWEKPPEYQGIEHLKIPNGNKNP